MLESLSPDRWAGPLCEERTKCLHTSAAHLFLQQPSPPQLPIPPARQGNPRISRISVNKNGPGLPARHLYPVWLWGADRRAGWAGQCGEREEPQGAMGQMNAFCWLKSATESVFSNMQKN